MTSLYIHVRAVLRFFMFVGVILLFFARGSVIYLSESDPVKRRRKLTRNGQAVAKMIVRSFNVELICKNIIPEDESSLLVGNHVGFIDIVCLCALRNNVFITSLEMKQTPVLGQIAELGGCAYVNRKNRMSIQQELQDMVNVLKEGFRVVLYAESVASNGEQVLPFKKTLIMSAGLSGRPIRPFVFNFRQINGAAVRYEQRDAVCWYGDRSFFSAIWASLKLDSVTCEIEFLPLVHARVDEDRTDLAQRLHSMVSVKYVPFRNDMHINAERI